MKTHAAVVLISCALVCAAACGSHQATSTDEIPGVPLDHQRRISRAEFGFRWPFSVGVGVLGCDQSQTILFRTQGTTYELSARPHSGPDIASLRLYEPTGPPSNPLRRLKQD